MDGAVRAIQWTRGLPRRCGSLRVIMEYARRFKFLVCVPAFNEADLEGARLLQILAEVEQDGYTIMRARRDEAWVGHAHHRSGPAADPGADSG
jgi:hypothetical protein